MKTRRYRCARWGGEFRVRVVRSMDCLTSSSKPLRYSDSADPGLSAEKANGADGSTFGMLPARFT